MEKRCRICLGDTTEFEHNNTNKHRFNFLLFEYKEYRKALVKDRHGMTVKIEPEMEALRSRCKFTERKGTYEVSVTPEEMLSFDNMVKFRCTITNTKMEESVYLTTAVVLYPHPCYNLIDPAEVISKGLIPKLSPKSNYVIILKLQIKEMGISNFKIPVSFSFQTENEKKPDTFTISRSILVCIESKREEAEAPEKSPFTNLNWDKNIKIQPSTDTHFQKYTEYTIPKNYFKYIAGQLKDLTVTERGILVSNSTPVLEEIAQKLRPGRLTLENYREFLHILLWLEEFWVQVGLMHYSMENVKLKIDGKRTLSLFVPGLAEKRPSVIVGDYIQIRVHNDHTGYEGVITNVGDTTVDISNVNNELLETLKMVPDIEMDVRFILGRLVYVRRHRAVDAAIKHNLVRHLFPKIDRIQAAFAGRHLLRPDDLFDNGISRNREQLQAVVNIVNGTSGTRPYIVFGPPGTGKTVTIVEAMLQLKRLTSKRILVCAPANAACNMLASKLSLNCSHQELIRVLSASADRKTLPPDLLKYTNIIEDEVVGVTAEKLAKFRIVVTTLMLAGKYVAGGNGRYTPDVVFIDEAAQASEPEALIPLGLFRDNPPQVVLAGDPKQLGPVVGSTKAKEFGLGVSMLERLMELELYKPLNDGRHNPNFITMLVLNFRSHGKILDIPNRLFYMGRLVAVSVLAHNDPVSNVHVFRTINLKHGCSQAAKGAAVEFCSVVAKERREGRSPSYFNPQEVQVVEKYVRTLCAPKLGVKPAQIGVVTPYVRQVYKIKMALKQFPEIEVGTTEAFQGREKRVIIVSTVRGQQDLLLYDRKYDLGFVENAKRFNVALTRAKSKLIVVGNPLVLGTDAKWLMLIRECEEAGTFCGAQYVLRTDEVREEVKKKMRRVHMQDSQHQNQQRRRR